MPLIDEPQDLLLDDANDLVIEDGDLVFVRGIDAVKQACRIAMQMFRGEWFLDLDAGLPYWEQILGRKPAGGIEVAQLLIRNELRRVRGVVEVTRLDVSFTGATRRLSARWQVRTFFGETDVDTIVIATGEYA